MKSFSINQINKKQKFINILFNFFLFIFCFFDLFVGVSNYFNYLDEIVSIIFFLYYLINVFRENFFIEKKDVLIIFSMILLFLIGIIGNYVNLYQTNIYIIFLDVLSTFKYIFVYLGARCFFSSNQCEISSKKQIIFFVEIYLYILFICGCINFVFDIGMSNEIRYGVRNFSFIFSVPGILINHCCVCGIALLSKSKMKKIDYFSIIICCFIMIMTLKSRGFVLSATLFFIFILKIRDIKKINWIYILAILLILLLIGWPQFKYYFIDNKGPRFLFFEKSFELANRYYIIGTGFSTYGSGTASQFYSSLYYELGFNHKYGLSPEINFYLNDTFWPSILGQFGYLGLILYLYIFISINKNMINKNKKNYYAIIFLFANAWLSSIQSAFVSSSYFVGELLLTIYLVSCKDNCYDN